MRMALERVGRAILSSSFLEIPVKFLLPKFFKSKAEENYV